MAGSLKDRRRLVAGRLHRAHDVFRLRQCLGLPAHRCASFFESHHGAGDTQDALNRFSHVPRAVVAIHARDREL